MNHIIQYYSNISYYINQNQDIKQFLINHDIQIKKCIKNNQINNSNFIYSIIFLSIYNNYKNIYNKQNSTNINPTRIYNFIIIFDIIKIFIDYYSSTININEINNIVLYQIINQYNLFINDNIKINDNLNIVSFTDNIINIIKDINTNINKCYNDSYQKIDKISNNIINKVSALNISPINNNINGNIYNKLSHEQETKYINSTYLILSKTLFQLFNKINNIIFDNKFNLSEEIINECSDIFSYYIKIISDFYNFSYNFLNDKNVSFNILINFGFTYAYKEYQEVKNKLIKVFTTYNLYTYTFEHIINSIDSYIELFLSNSIMSDSN